MNMKKTVYIQPLVEAINAESESFIAASPLTGTSIDGLDIDETPTDAEGLSRALDLPFEF